MTNADFYFTVELFRRQGTDYGQNFRSLIWQKSGFCWHDLFLSHCQIL